ncbi:unnamed protein product [Psylliodes chrysocephalus]|uniref:Uncharacterized protein n=1 Tax=Psylliodes chrysocephalus TaxID=3402493 RepID=A0A9P0D7T2_9CUCU|nr:unnamed protein product [Psylliodes chrysocephala]
MTLTLNLDKTKFLTFSCNKSNCSNFQYLSIPLDNVKYTIRNVKSITYLGIEIDQHLKWDIHVNKIIKKLISILFTFKKMRNILQTNELKVLYHALVESHLQYGISDWGGMYTCHSKNLEVIQKFFLKIIYKRNKTYPTENLFQETSIFSLRKLYFYRMLCLQQKNKQHLKSISHIHNIRHKKSQNLKPQEPQNQLVKKHFTLLHHVFSQKFLILLKFEIIFTIKKKLKIWFQQLSENDIQNMYTISK